MDSDDSTRANIAQVNETERSNTVYNVSYLVKNTPLFTETVKAPNAFAALDVAHQRQPVLATFCNTQDPKHPSKHIGPQGIEVRVYEQATDDADADTN